MADNDPDNQRKNKAYEALMAEAAGYKNAWVTPVLDVSSSMLGTGYMGKPALIVPQAEYAPNDDVVFYRDDKKKATALHRVTHVKPGFVYTKGINNRVGDGWIPIKDVIGKVISPKPKM